MVENKFKNMLLSIINKYLPQAKVYLFGSRATEEFYEGSDIDIAVDCGKIVDYDMMMKIKRNISESDIPFFVDVVDINNVDEIMRSQILKYGIVWKK
jgi:predicted nucleotidyltransferase